MPSSVQIVPRYDFPHVDVRIYDNTETTEIPQITVDDTYKTIHVFRSGRGIDNKIVKRTDTKSFQETFGETDFAKYGQPLMMPYASLSSENTSVYAMRVMPHDATYANAAVLMYYRSYTATVDEPVLDEYGNETYAEDGYTPLTTQVEKPMFQVIFRTERISPEVDPETNRLVEEGSKGVTSDAVMAEEVKKLVQNIPATDGGPDWVCVPIMRIRSTGRGVYGNSYRFRISPATDWEKDYATKMYQFDVIDTSSSAISIATYVGAMATSIINNKSVQMNDIVADYDPGDYPLEVYVYEGSIDKVYDEYVAFLEGVAAEHEEEEIVIPAEKEFDIFFGKELASATEGAAYEHYQVVTDDSDVYPVVDDDGAMDLSDPVGTTLVGGYDGALSTFIGEENESINGASELMTADMYIELMKNGVTHLKMGEATVEDYLYALAFNGLLDKSILSKTRIPCDYLMDANYSYSTKLSLAQFGIKRNECLTYIDLGTEYETFSNSVLLDIKKKYSGIFRDRLISLNAHHWKTTDPFTMRKVEVTPTYFYASALPVHWRNFGRQQPFATAYAQITGQVKGSMAPIVDDFESEIKQQLSDLRVNYIEPTGENSFRRGIQNTAQTINSDLLEENNVHVLMYIKRRIEQDCYENLYNFADASDRATFKMVEEAKFEYMNGSLVQSIEIDFDMNEYEHDRQILHCYVAIQFRSIAKRVIVEIDVNKRDYNG